MTKVYIVQGSHWAVSGQPMSAHASMDLATQEAVSLVNVMLKDSGRDQDATANNWESRIETLQDEHGAQHTWIEIIPLNINGPAPA